MTTKKIQCASYTLAIITVLAIVFCQLFAFIKTTPKSETRADQNDLSGEESAPSAFHFSIAASNLPSPTHIEVNQTFVCLLNVLFERIDLKIVTVQTDLSGDKLLRILLRTVISPNAP